MGFNKIENTIDSHNMDLINLTNYENEMMVS